MLVDRDEYKVNLVNFASWYLLIDETVIEPVIDRYKFDLKIIHTNIFSKKIKRECIKIIDTKVVPFLPRSLWIRLILNQQ